MPFSLNSYLLGVGTVVGALAFGFGGGVFLSNTAMKESPAGPTRVERLARADPEPPAASPTPAAPTTLASNQAAAAPNQVAAPDPHDPAPAAAIKQDASAQQPAAVRSDPVPASQTEPPKPIDAAKEPQPAKQIEQTGRTEAKPVESRDTDRTAERSRRYAERRPRDIAVAKMRQRKIEVQEEPAQDVVLSRPPEQHFDLFGGLFGRPADAND